MISMIPNALSLMRIFATPFVLAALFYEYYFLSLAIFILASISDFLDGCIARHYSVTSPFGEFIDPIADKGLTVSVYAMFFWMGKLSLLFFMILLIREVGATLHRFVMLNEMRCVASRFLGKVKCVLQVAHLIFFIIIQIYPLTLYFPLLVAQIITYLFEIIVLYSIVRSGLAIFFDALRMDTEESRQTFFLSNWRQGSIFLVSVFGIGFFPVAPGTVASLFTVLLWWRVAPLLGFWLQVALIATIFFAGCLLSKWAMRKGVESDPSWIVIDEFVGQAIALLGVPHAWPWWLGAFLAFRFFDIVKPYPISWLEKKYKNAFGVMVDDVAAGGAALILLKVISILMLKA